MNMSELILEVTVRTVTARTRQVTRLHRSPLTLKQSATWPAGSLQDIGKRSCCVDHYYLLLILACSLYCYHFWCSLYCYQFWGVHYIINSGVFIILSILKCSLYRYQFWGVHYVVINSGVFIISLFILQIFKKKLPNLVSHSNVSLFSTFNQKNK